jgi:membrane-associated phospholipid phosphatase
MKCSILLIVILFSVHANAQNFTTAPLSTPTLQNASEHDNDDSSRIIGHVYHVNAWGSLGITLAGTAASLATYSFINNKPDITDQEFDALQSQSNKDAMNALDRLSLKFSMPSTNYTWTAVGVQALCAGLPLTLFFGDRFKKNWDDIFLMLLETNAIAVTLYQVSPFGPFFQNKYRPIVYVAGNDPIARDSLRSGKNRNSFYSGHVASAVASTYFMAKVYCDYHPEIHGWDQIGIYALASVPPLALAYLRLVALKHFPSDVLCGWLIGGVCGVAIPEIHRIAGKNVSLGAYTSPTSTGLTLGVNIK